MDSFFIGQNPANEKSGTFEPPTYPHKANPA